MLNLLFLVAGLYKGKRSLAKESFGCKGSYQGEVVPTKAKRTRLEKTIWEILRLEVQNCTQARTMNHLWVKTWELWIFIKKS